MPTKCTHKAIGENYLLKTMGKKSALKKWITRKLLLSSRELIYGENIPFKTRTRLLIQQ